MGALPAAQLAESEAPLSEALETGAGLPWAASLTAFGALVAITSVLLVILYGQTRIFFAMARDGLVPESWADVNPRTGTPVKLTIGFGIFAALVAALVPLGAIVEMVNIGTLFAFVAAVQGASSLHLVPDRHPPLHLPDLGPAVGDLRPVRRMACRRDRDLPAVRVLALPAAAPLPRRPRPARHRARRPSDPRNTNPEAR